MELLYFILQDLTRDRLKYLIARNGPDRLPSQLPIEVADLELKAREMGIYDLRPFWASRLFQSNGFSLDPSGRSINKVL